MDSTKSCQRKLVLFAVGVALMAGAFAAPADFQLIFLALGLGSITFSGVGADVTSANSSIWS